MCISCASVLLGDCSTTSYSSGYATKEASYRKGASNFENKITSREDMLITETEDVLKEIYNFMGKVNKYLSYHLKNYLTELVRLREDDH